MFMLFRLRLYVAADHVPSKAKDWFGLMAQPEQLGPFQKPLGR
jgi:hypothetical protein